MSKLTSHFQVQIMEKLLGFWGEKTQRTIEKTSQHLQELLFFQTGKRSSQEARQASLLQGKIGLTVPGGQAARVCDT